MGHPSVRRLDRIVTAHNDVDVWENADGSIDFEVIGATHATWHPHRLLTGHAWDAITAACLLHPGKPASILMLGLGGGTVFRQLRHFLPDASLTAVEIDGDMIRLAYEYMRLDSLRVEVIHDDAFGWLQAPRGPYDIVIDDLYRCGENDVERPESVSLAYVQALLPHLAPSGSLIMNLVIGKGHRNTQRAARAAFLHHFPSLRAVRPPLSINEVLCGTRDPLGTRDGRSLRRVASLLSDERDHEVWNQLRTLKLR